jgi:Transposase IS200 like
MSKRETDFPGSARAPRVVSGAAPETAEEVRYSKRRLPHFERPWSKYAVAFSTYRRKQLTHSERDLLESILYAHDHDQYELYAACVMPDHVHLLFEPQIRTEGEGGQAIFWPLSEILKGIKSANAHRINKAAGKTGPVWEKESFDRLIRSEADLREKFRYICGNPWDSGVIGSSEDYPWLWTQEDSSTGASKRAREARALPGGV